MTSGLRKPPDGCAPAPGRPPGLPGWIAAGLLTVLPAWPAAAQLSVDRLTLDLHARPGESRLGVITIRNTGDTTVQAVIRLEDWDRAEDGANRWFPLGTVDGSCGPALDVFPPTVSLDPGAAQAIRITLDSTASLSRECWAAAIVETATPPPSSGTGVGYVIRTAIKIYVLPPGLVAEGEVTSLAVTTMPEEGDTVPAVVLGFSNTGGLHLEGRGQLQVRTPDNTVLHTIPLPIAYALPGARMRVRAPFPALPPGRYVLLAVVDYGGAELAAGQMEYVVP